ncbi:MAG: PilZ domain-containing protein [Lachnospiraceae bacterium]|nr:PilZ domain-containing protein [Lachnospiraceae bacterium]
MFLGELPKTGKIIISFELQDQAFEFTTDLIDDALSDPHIACAVPISTGGCNLHIDHRCANLCIRYQNLESGEVYLWENARIRYSEDPAPRYIIMSPDSSRQFNRRGAVRVPVNFDTECSISDIDGVYPCTIHDVSITGIGVNFDISIAGQELKGREVSTRFYDEVINKAFRIKGRCVQTTRLTGGTVRCGCEILEVEPSINEYINFKQLRLLSKTLPPS